MTLRAPRATGLLLATLVGLACADEARAQTDTDHVLGGLRVEGDPVALVSASVHVTCERASETVIRCVVRESYAFEPVTERATNVAIRAPFGDAPLSCKVAYEESDCAAVTLTPHDWVWVERRSEITSPLRFETRWIHDPRVSLDNVHIASPAVAGRHSFTGSSLGRVRAARVAFRWLPPSGASGAESLYATFTVEGPDVLHVRPRHNPSRFGRHAVLLVDPPFRSSYLGGPVAALGGVIHAGFAVRAGYELGFGRRVPLALEIAYEWAERRGHAVVPTLYLYTPTIARLGAGIGIGPSVRFDDGSFVGARLALDVSLGVRLQALFTFERHAPVSVGLFAGMSF